MQGEAVASTDGLDPELASQLCMQCGLCCTGAIHDKAKLGADEVERARDAGLPVSDGEKPSFAMPCPMFRGSACAIYAGRPKSCRSYKCRLLEQLQAGDVSFAEASGKVASAKALLGKAEELMPANMTLVEARAQITRPTDRDAELRLRTAAVNLYLDRHFRNARDGKLFALAPLGG